MQRGGNGITYGGGGGGGINYGPLATNHLVLEEQVVGPAQDGNGPSPDSDATAGTFSTGGGGGGQGNS